MTIQSPDMHDGLGVSAIGHFSMHVDNNGGDHKFFDKPQWVNGCSCSSCENIPVQYTFQKEFDLPTPTKGTWFDIWISIYWSCINVSARRSCQSQDVHYYGYVMSSRN
ncbi:hypothetical protein RhiirA4_395013 [Rhizophagus irregularis]|uniref:Uncharacterized protein n=1 Tax=Rhizophagus irregularis TaxID=588596 RepID=A0A2I1G232_9GLOM|nr:hypothetical protein RhiirA4_395013 [Rhizophagus irregularis]